MSDKSRAVALLASMGFDSGQISQAIRVYEEQNSHKSNLQYADHVQDIVNILFSLSSASAAPAKKKTPPPAKEKTPPPEKPKTPPPAEVKEPEVPNEHPGIFTDDEWVEIVKTHEKKEGISKEKGSWYILHEALNFLVETKIDKFKRILKSFSGKYDINQPIVDTSNDAEIKLTLWQHLVKSYPNIQAWRYLLYIHKDGMSAIDANSSGKKWSALQTALYYQQDDLVKACLYANEHSSFDRSVKEFGDEWRLQESIAHVFANALREASPSTKEFDSCIDILSKALVICIDKKQPFYRDIFNFLNIYSNDSVVSASSGKGGGSKEDEKTESNSSNDSSLNVWTAASNKLSKEIFVGSTLYKTPQNAYWFKKYFRDNPLWCMKNRWTDLKGILHGGLQESSDNLALDMSRMINSKESIWKMIGEFKLKCDDWKDPLDHRQDVCTYGLQSAISEMDLLEISLNSSSLNFDATQSYDKQVYLTNLICRGHIIDPHWQSTVKQLFQKQANTGKVVARRSVTSSTLNGGHVPSAIATAKLMAEQKDKEDAAAREKGDDGKEAAAGGGGDDEDDPDDLDGDLHRMPPAPPCNIFAGPVKSREQCIVKAESTFCRTRWPQTASILDIVRTTVTFHDTKGLLAAIRRFTKYLKAQPSLGTSDFKNDPDSVHLEVMKLVNGFAQHSLKKDRGDFSEVSRVYKLPIPRVYRDITFNLVITKWDPAHEKYISIVGELTFLLKPMLVAKRRQKQFDQVLRREQLVDESTKYYEGNAYETQMALAGTTNALLCPLIVNYPQNLTPEFFRKKDAESGQTLLMNLAKSKSVKSLLLTDILSVAPVEVWTDTDENGDTLLHWLVYSQFREDIIKIFFNHLRSFGDEGLISRCWEAKNEADLTPYAYVVEKHDFLDSERHLLDAIPEKLRKDHAYMFEVQDADDESNILHFLLSNDKITSSIDKLIDGLKFVQEGVKDKENWWNNICIKKNEYGKIPLGMAFNKVTDLSPELINLLVPKFDGPGDGSSTNVRQFWTRDMRDGDNRNSIHMVLANGEDAENCVDNLTTLFEHIDDRGIVGELLQQKDHRRDLPLFVACWKLPLTDRLIRMLVPPLQRSDLKPFWCSTNRDKDNILHMLLWYKRHAGEQLHKDIETIFRCIDDEAIVRTLFAMKKRGAVLPSDLVVYVKDDSIRSRLARLFDKYTQ